MLQTATKTKKKNFVPKPHFVPMEEGTGLEGIRKDVFLDRYSLKDIDGTPMEVYPEQMWRRVSWGIAQVEKGEGRKKEWEEKFYKAMEGFKFVPAGRILSGAGTGYEVTYYNCYVIPSPGDSRQGIMDNISLTVEIQARGGGVGINLSSLRPRGARVKKVNGTSSGPVNWASLYSTANHDVIQQGGTRRGALMLMLNDWHPDVEEFVTVKQDLTKIPGANLSVCVGEDFMKAVKEDGEWELIFPDLDYPEYDEVWDGDITKWKKLGLPVRVYKKIKARELWNLIAQAAWRSAEPGVVFIDRYNELSNSWYFEKIIATNPCGEQGLGAWGVCNLGHINLAPFIKGTQMDWEMLKEHVSIAVRFLDNVIDSNYYFSKENERVQKHGIRRTGLGTLGLADALIKMGIRYGSKESLEVIGKIYKTIRDTAYETSSELAKEKGAFPKFDKEKYLQGKFIQTLPAKIREKIAKNGIRNGILLTQAPTGTISILAGVSSGIEPVYEFSYKRTDRTGEHIVHHPLYQEWLDKNPQTLKPDYFVSASELTPEEHIRVQGMIQKYVDASISKTVNAPNSHGVDDVKKLYNLAYELGCKGVTYFRDGSRMGVLSKTDKEEEKKEENHEPIKERPFKVIGATYRLVTPVGSAFITINEDEGGDPMEVFINVGKAGSDVAAMAEALGRTISTALRFRGDLTAKDRAEEIAHQLSGIGGRRSVGFGPNKIRSLPDAIAAALSSHYGFKVNGNGNHAVSLAQAGATSNVAGAVMAANGSALADQPALVGSNDPTMASAAFNGASEEHNGELNGLSKDHDLLVGDICPSCGASSLVFQEGCSKCYSCGHAEC